MSLCDRELQRAFRHYNRKYFNRQLPEDVDCFFSPVENCYGLVRLEEGGWLLQINPKFAIDDKIWKMTLLHELCHLKLYPNLSHGRRFQDEMKRLALDGAFANLW